MPVICRLYFLIIILINQIKNKEIIIPFTSFLSEIPKNLTPTDFMRALIKNELYTNIKLGTPPQNLDIIIDFKNYHSYIIKDNKNDHKNYKRFYNDSSSTFKILGQKEYFNYLDNSYGINSSDILTINENITNLEYQFLQIISVNKELKIQYPGVLGFGVVPNGEPFHFELGLIRQLKEKNITDNFLYTLVFNNNDDFNGKIILEKNIYEEYPQESFNSGYCLTTYEYEFYWGWNYYKSYFNSQELGIKNIYLKPELGVLLVNINIKKNIASKYFEEKISEGKCYEGYQSYSFYYCDIDAKIEGNFLFEFKKTNTIFTLTSEDLTLIYNNKKYFLIGFGNIVPQDEIYLGYPFFRKYDIIFNQDKRIAGFYNFKIDKKTKNNKSQSEEKYQNEDDEVNKAKKNLFFQKLAIIILSIFCVLLFLYFIFYIYRAIKRKTKGKLMEELNDTSNV